jgi:hypothetical protein
VTTTEVVVQLHGRAHLTIVIASGGSTCPSGVPWWNGVPVRLTT